VIRKHIDFCLMIIRYSINEGNPITFLSDSKRFAKIFFRETLAGTCHYLDLVPQGSHYLLAGMFYRG